MMYTMPKGLLTIMILGCLGQLFSSVTSVALGQPTLGIQKRFGDEIMVCGQLYRIGAPVKLWLDPGGFDAYRTDRRFAPLPDRKWKRTVEEMQAGKIDFVTKPQETSPDRYHVQENKTDPGPALDWEYLLTETKKQMEKIKAVGATR